MSEEIEELDAYDFPDRGLRRCGYGYDMESYIELTRENLEFLMEEHNKLVRAIKELRGDSDEK